VAEIKGETPVERIEPELRLPVSAFLPAEYVAGSDQRLVLYRRLSAVEEEEELEELKGEMIDRFGPLPEEAASLVETIRLKTILRRVGVSRLDAGATQAALTFHPTTRVEPDKLVALVRSAPKKYKLTPDQQLVVFSSNPLAEARKVLDRFLTGCN
jgi:transcription-repair coupling factor (superfamily II helicase)